MVDQKQEENVIMTMEEIYKDLNTRVGLGNSKYLDQIWQILCTEEEAKIAALLPGKPEDIAKKSKKDLDDIRPVLHSLFIKGAAFKGIRDGETIYKLPKNLIQFHDASLLWEGATTSFYDLWKRVMDEEFTGVMSSMPPEAQLPSFMRVLPIQETVEKESALLTYEECKKLIESSQKVAVVKCPCRLSQQNCDRLLEACIQLNRGAEYVLDRGHGREITKAEAMALLKSCEEAGLVHMVENRNKGNVICNCCSCCCEMFRLVTNTKKKWILSPSRYMASIGEACTACGACLEICPVEAISLAEQAEIDEEACLGCGLCATACQDDAIVLKQVRPEDHIPS